MEVKARILGSGGSYGTPGICCDCPVCTSTDPKDTRFRTSCLVTIGDKNYLIDACPDIRQIILRDRICQIDALLLTHHHEDHMGGLNDLRPMYLRDNQVPMPLYLSSFTLQQVEKRFGYCLDRFKVHLIDKQEGQEEFFHYCTYEQAGVKVNGFRFGDFAYVTDIKVYPESIFEALKGVDVLVLGSLHHLGSIMHFSFEEAIAFSRKVGAKRTILTHIAHEILHEKENVLLPEGVEIGFDGMDIYVGAGPETTGRSI